MYPQMPIPFRIATRQRAAKQEIRPRIVAGSLVRSQEFPHTESRMLRLLLFVLPLYAQAPANHRNFERDLGTQCAHCHTADQWTDGSKPAFDRTRRMFAMAAEINAGPLQQFGQVTCWTCHRGNAKPARIPRVSWEAISAEWPEGLPDDRRLAMSVYSASLGVGCDHCHVGTDWKREDKLPWKTAQVMVSMMGGMPKHFEAPRPPQFQCFSCHQGSLKPQRTP